MDYWYLGWISAAGKILRVHGLAISASEAEMANYGDMP
jgi:hypothetical protein